MHTERATGGRRSSRLRRELSWLVATGGLIVLLFLNINAPHTIKFMSMMGASEIQFGILGAIPMISLALQFVGAALANRVTSRKRIVVGANLFARLIYFGIILLIMFRDREANMAVVWGLLIIFSVVQMIMSATQPLWFSWVADVVPGPLFNKFWGTRYRWIHLTWGASSLGIVLFTSWCEVTLAFPIITGVAVFCAFIELLFLFGIREPKHETATDMSWLTALAAPWQTPLFRRFTIFAIVHYGSVMLTAVFLQVYLLEVVGFPVWLATMIPFCSGIGGAFAAPRWGKVLDRRGRKPVIVMLSWVKIVVPLVYIFVTDTKDAWWLLPFNLLDGSWNSGLMISQDGYMLSAAPKRNRSMYVATILGIGGIVGGLSAGAGGWYLETLSGETIRALGWLDLSSYQALFVTGASLRVIAAVISRQLMTDPRDHRVSDVWRDSFRILGPRRWLETLKD